MDTSSGRSCTDRPVPTDPRPFTIPIVMNNPYTPFAPTLKNFFGRGDVLDAFSARLTPGTANYRDSRHILIVGVGGIGKTSLLRKLEARVHDSSVSKAYCVSIDWGDFLYDLSGLLGEMYAQLPEKHGARGGLKRLVNMPPSATTKSFFTRISQGLRDGVAIGIGFPPSISVEFSPGTFFGRLEHPQSLVRQCAILCDCVLASLPRLDGTLVILIDQLGKISEVPGGFILMRSLLELVKSSAGNSKLLVVAAVRPERKGVLEHWFREDVFHPEHFARFPLYPLDIPAARQVITEPAAREGVILSNSLVDTALAKAGRHPYFLQLACFRIWKYLASEDKFQESPVELEEGEISELVREGQRAVFADFGPEEQFLLKLLALAWPVPLTTLEIKEKTEAAGKIHLIDVDHFLQLLVSHKHRPVKFHEAQKAFSITHDLFAEYIRRHECNEEQRELAVLQRLIDSAPQFYEMTAALVTASQLAKLWQYREALRLRPKKGQTVCQG